MAVLMQALDAKLPRDDADAALPKAEEQRGCGGRCRLARCRLAPRRTLAYLWGRAGAMLSTCMPSRACLGRSPAYRG